MQAVILAGGFGTRLQEIAKDIPKPLVEVNGKPFLTYLLLMLKHKGIKDFIICTGYLADKIEDYYGKGDSLGISIKYSREEKPLYSGGAVKKAQHLLEQDFFVINGDSYVPLDYKKAFSEHKKKNSQITLVVSPWKFIHNYPHNFILKDGRLCQNYNPETSNNVAHAGVCILNKRVLEKLKPEKPISIEKELFEYYKLQKKLRGFLHTGYLIDIGTPEKYHEFKKDLINGLVGLDAG